MFFLFNLLISIGISIVDTILGLGFLSTLYMIAILIPALSIGARRLHDTGKSGWWQLLYLLPIVGTIVMIIFLVLDSDKDNEYGPNSKSADASATPVSGATPV
jgi:uncharacterized membrane protein YhaH (DUF805 family)